MNTYEVYAIKYAERDAIANNHYHGSNDAHENYYMPMDYFIWVAKSKEYTVVIDVGFNETIANKRGRTFLRCPIKTLEKLDIEVKDVPYVVLTHMHYDHVGNLMKFPHSTFVIQEKEMSFWTGKHASRGEYKHLIEVEDIVHLVRENFKGKITFVSDHKEILPGITVYNAGGHSPGLQFVKVQTEQGNVILTSDVSHFYTNFEEDRPFTIVHELSKMYDAFDLVRSVSDDSTIIVPGHDPKVMERFSSPTTELNGIAVQIK
ncbi:N-acyl homoserine lactonase family protein [Oceanobacillus halophilus]|uniref:N-acyl homoserine lactonase family protein n=1 Tax=Oceanobacillus halophilus TaxID=930130 RepID=A0A495A7L2_9BACI|nr:N-acyl homoserine lactonase family protein [Oceanobacillus halophilus]RKQ35780.1 N-acyl homoserine lactonase family protein [Oceanobacillus halophilus]